MARSQFSSQFSGSPGEATAGSLFVCILNHSFPFWSHLKWLGSVEVFSSCDRQCSGGLRVGVTPESTYKMELFEGNGGWGGTLAWAWRINLKKKKMKPNINEL